MVSMLSHALAEVVTNVVSISTRMTQENIQSSLQRPGAVESVVLLAAKESVVINIVLIHNNIMYVMLPLTNSELIAKNK
jgi:hypothetical protein